MAHRLKTLFGNVALLLASLMFVLAVFEYGVFKYILPTDDVLPSVTINKVVRYAPNTRAVFHRGDGSTDLVTINANGWNSTKATYVENKDPGTLRVAVIGDSYVHGAYVDVQQGFPELIETKLRAKGANAEVMRFGADGAPLSQYLNVLREEVVKYSPDIVVIQLIHNDFDESYRFLGTRYASSFMKVVEDEAGRIREVPAQEFKPGLADRLRAYRSFRYLYYQTGLYKKARYYVNRYWWGGEERPNIEEFTSSAVDIRNIRELDKIRRISRHIFEEMEAMARKHGFKLAFAMDGVREAVYADKDPSSFEVGALNTIVGEEMRAMGSAYVDYHTAFQAHYKTHQKRFEFPYDWHWNELGNEIVADALVRLITTHDKLLGAASVASASAQTKP